MDSLNFKAWTFLFLEESIHRIQQTAEDAADEAEIDLDISPEIADVGIQINSANDVVDAVATSLRQFVAFVKTFSADEFGTIYCEREWRALRAYSFSYEDLAMIVLPRRLGAQKYFDDFVKRVAPKLRLPRAVPIVPWEDLVEH